ncbi:MAG: hypothetical protein WAL98_03655 [Desulfatiglandaceae bacterium]
MKWDVFRAGGRTNRNPVIEAIERQAKVIEKTAPANYHHERERYYYNYKIMPLYRKPLLSFIETVSRREGLKRDPAALAKEIFLSLKDFYDPRGKAALEEILSNPGFLRKFRDVYVYFYDADAPVIRDILGREGVG